MLQKLVLASFWFGSRLLAARNMTTNPSATSSDVSFSPVAHSQVNLLELASAAVACTVTAARSIRRLANSQNARLKQDGSFVTDADLRAQGVIVQAIRSVSPLVRVVGEESPEEMASHVDPNAVVDQDILQRARQEIRLVYHHGVVESLPLAQSNPDHSVAENVVGNGHATDSSYEYIRQEPKECIVDVDRVSIFVDPLDGTKSYAHGDFDSVSILIAIVVDNQPCFGVIGKPFGYAGLTSIRDTGCVTIYGGPLIQAAYVAGGKRLVPFSLQRGGPVDHLPRAVISSSRSKGVVRDFCLHLGSKGLIAPEPCCISGAGEKSLRLILQTDNQALWFFPKKGTSLWDVAASDALLRVLNGKLTDKFGNELDYSKTREEAENVEGIVACIDSDLHAECIRLFKEGDWATRL